MCINLWQLSFCQYDDYDDDDDVDQGNILEIFLERLENTAAPNFKRDHHQLIPVPKIRKFLNS